MTGTGPAAPDAGPTGETGGFPAPLAAAEQARAAIARGDAASAVRAARQSGDFQLLARAYEMKALLDREPVWHVHALDALLSAAAQDGRDETCNAAIDLALKIGALDQSAGHFRALLARQADSAAFARALERVRDLALLQVPEPTRRAAAPARAARMFQDMMLFPLGLILTLTGMVTREVWSKPAGVLGVLLIVCWSGLRLSRLARWRPPPSGW